MTVPPRPSPVSLLLAVVLAAPVAAAGPPPKHEAQHPKVSARPRTAKLQPPAQRVAAGRSVGSPTDGHLIGGAHLDAAPYLRVVPVYLEGDARWGLEPLVTMIDRAGRAVRKQFPDSVLSVGHLSRPGGGNIDRHASHESGRDADIGFYVKNQQGRPIYADHFVAFKGDGTAPTWPGAQFDDARNWALVASIVDGNPGARVTHVFVATPIRARLLQYAERVGAPPALRNRAAELMAQPRGSLPHDDHFHVRIGCPTGMDRCVEIPLARRHRDSAASLAKARDQASARSGAHEHGGAHEEARASHDPRAKRAQGTAPGSTPKPTAPRQRHAEDRDRDRTDEPEKEEASRSEPSVPNLAPMVPGLDSVVIPAPLENPAKADEKPAPPGEQPIDDPDGVLSPF